MNKTILNPNFSIVAPGGCNAKCSFCFWENKNTDDNYINGLSSTLDNAPSQFNQLSITGGEPTMSPHLPQILESIDRDKWEKVVLTTNGYKLLDNIRLISRKVDHINISRHHWDDMINEDVFGTDTVPNNKLLSYIIDRVIKSGMTATLSVVLGDYINTQEDVLRYIKYAKDMGVKQVFFRKKHGTLEPTDAEKSFYFIESSTHECGVCRNTTQKIDGVNVVWKASLSEPSKEMGEIFEVIYNQNGNLTADWGQEIPLDINNIIDDGVVELVKEIKDKRIKLKEEKINNLKNMSIPRMTYGISSCGLPRGGVSCG